MFSKGLTLKISCLALAMVWFSGCSNDHNFIDPETIVSLAYDTNCLDQLEPDFELYQKELLSDARLAEDFECLRDALDYVKLRVEGENIGVFTSDELKGFLNKVFFKDEPMPDSFYQNLVAVKSQFFGGNETNISFADFDNLKVFLTSLESTAVALKPFASEIMFDEVFKDKASVNRALSILTPFLSRWIGFSQNSINLNTVLSLVEDAGTEITSKDNWIPIFNLIRETEAGETEVAAQDKEKLVTVFDRYFSTALNLNRVLDTDWEYKREDFGGLSAEVKSALSTLESTLNGHPLKKWGKTDLVLFMNLVSDFEVFDQELKQDVREHIVAVVFGKWFESSVGGVELSSSNLQKISLVWSDVEDFVEESVEIEGFVGQTFPFVKEGDSLFALFTNQLWPSVVRKDRTLLIPDYEPEVTFSFQSLFHAAWQFAAAKLLVATYTSQEEESLSLIGITIEEVEEAYLDVFVFLKEIEFLDEDSRGSWFRIFNEGNIFVPSANPDGVVDVSEAADYAAYMFSAVFIGEAVGDAIQKECPNFVEKCSFTYARKNADVVFEALPGLVGYFQNGLKKKSYLRWQKGFEYVAKLVNDDKDYESSHWFRGTVANQYNEVIFRKFDTDGSDSLSFEEVSAAFVDFKEALKLLPQVKGTENENKDDVLKSFLTLFVKDGKLPKLANGRPRGKLIRHVLVCGSVSTSTNKECVFESDRSKIMALLAYLTSI